MSNYAQLLKHMLNFLDIKFIVLANTLGYDISYISKWCNGTKIPSLKSVSTIHKQMSTLFANEVVTNKKASLFFVEFNLDYSEEKDNIQEIKFLEETILTLLNKTYYLENPVLEIGEKNEIDGEFVTLVTNPRHGEVINNFFKQETKPKKLSNAALETLAIIAYRQPVTKAEIEAIRGVSVDRVVQNMEEKKFIRICGKKDAIGRPNLYAITDKFLGYLGVKSIEELPNYLEIRGESENGRN